ncbi:MAG: hypothetical protein AAF609_13550 [Cyanobacteria bacterium P01_C01_bin.120]
MSNSDYLSTGNSNLDALLDACALGKIDLNEITRSTDYQNNVLRSDIEQSVQQAGVDIQVDGQLLEDVRTLAKAQKIAQSPNEEKSFRTAEDEFLSGSKLEQSRAIENRMVEAITSRCLAGGDIENLGIYLDGGLDY